MIIKSNINNNKDVYIFFSLQLIGKIEKKGKATKDSPAQKPDAEKLAAKQTEGEEGHYLS